MLCGKLYLNGNLTQYIEEDASKGGRQTQAAVEVRVNKGKVLSEEGASSV
jgi:hypothetical protein